MTTVEEQLSAVEDVLGYGVRLGMLQNAATDERLDGRTVTVYGRPLVNFGSCSYLGLETHPELTAAITEAAQRYGSQFSSSRGYLSSPGYAAAEAALAQLFDRPTLITPSTSTGHIAALPVLLGSRDALILDHQVHNSMQTAAKLVRVQGSAVELLSHNNIERLEKRIRELSRTHRRIWYAADGLYSMYADLAPIEALNQLAERYEQLWLYVDDAHSVSWTGRFGRGYALERLSTTARARTVVAASLNKSFAAAGGALTFPDDELRRRVFTIGGPLVFSGPVQPPMLGAVTASARLHLSDAVAPRRAHLMRLIDLFNGLATERGLPLVSPSRAPIRCLGVGTPAMAYRVTGLLREAGFFIDTATFPAVPAKRSGARVTLTAHHTEEDVTRLVDGLADALPRVLAEAGSSTQALRRAFGRQLAGGEILPVVPDTRDGKLVLEHHRSIDAIDPAEWDAMFGDRGALAWSGLRALEEAFADRRRTPRGGSVTEDRWAFHYWIVRDADGTPVAATCCTAARWKDDLLSAPEVSAEVERRRATDPDFLTSTMVATGTLLTEGDHLYLDRGRDWQSALRMVLAAAREVEADTEASGVVVRDVAEYDTELHDLLVAEGFLRLPLPDSWVRDVDFTDDEDFLAGLGKKARYHQRVNVLSWTDRYKVEVIEGGGAPLDPELRAHLYELYRAVHARNLRLNVYPLPERILDAVLARPGWELVLLRLVDGPELPVAYAVQHVGTDHVQPVFVGLDYRYVASHHAYQQTLWQAIASARRRGAARVLLGMGADLQKSRFGATPHRRFLYLQPTESYQADVLNQVTEYVNTTRPEGTP
jgi:7-keto-8-aminopelargonate synthetase-like enzyme